MSKQQNIENEIRKIAATADFFSNNSKEICKNSIYVAISGSNFDGHNFIEEAILNGAKYIIYQNDIKSSKKAGIKFIKVENSKLAYNFLARIFYCKQPANIVAVTGTCGKSSVVNIFHQIMTLLQKNSAIIGTNGVEGFYTDSSNNMTTPDAKLFFKYLSQASENNIEYLAFEASSHGLDQQRIDGVKLKSAAFTNFSQDHLDYHHTLQEYFTAKMLLFNKIMLNGNAVINADISEFSEILKNCANHNIIDYGKSAKYIKLLDTYYSNNQTTVELKIKDILYCFKVNLFGYFQIENLLCAIGLVLSLGFKIEDILKIITDIKPIKGRLEKVTATKNIFVDYAHKPDALEKVITTLQNLKTNINQKLILVFGCGGQRDTTKRPIMGDIAYKNADIVIVTDDNPRSEEPNNIRQQIISACPTAINIGDRKKAIKHGISLMNKDDILLIAGKGHENYQIVGTEKLDFDDAEIVRELLNK